MPAEVVAAWSAPCPGCTGEAWWQSSASNGGDLTRTTLTYQISCVRCDRPAPKPLAAALDLSRVAWLRRSA